MNEELFSRMRRQFALFSGTIERLIRERDEARARVKVLEEALRELADANFDEYCSDATESGEVPCTDDEEVSFGERPCSITFGMIRRARAALQEQSK
jgi:hypothetical protein